MKMTRSPTIVFDMDGTLVDVSSIRHLVAKDGKQRNFDEFHNRAVECPAIPWVREHALMAKADGFKVIQVTARQEKYRPSTSWWIAEHKIPSDALYMRANGDYRPDYEVKRDILNRISRRWNIVKAFDDNPAIISLWSEFNIPCVVVPGWEDNV